MWRLRASIPVQVEAYALDLRPEVERLAMTAAALAPFLPLRENVSAQPTDEGFLGLASATLTRPASRATLSRKGRGEPMRRPLFLGKQPSFRFSTLQPPRDVRRAPTWEVRFSAIAVVRMPLVEVAV